MNLTYKDLELIEEALTQLQPELKEKYQYAKGENREAQTKRYKSKYKLACILLELIDMEKNGIRTAKLKKRPKSKKWLRAIEGETRGTGVKK